MNDSSRCGMESVDIIPQEKIAFIAYNIGVYESVQKFGKITILYLSIQEEAQGLLLCNSFTT